MTSRWTSRMAAFLLWAMATASALYWGLKLVGASEMPVAAATAAELAPPISVADLAKALGPATVALPAAQIAVQPTPGPNPGANMRLLGVVAGRKSGGVALISIDGQIARPYRVGSRIDDQYRLTKVERRSATLSPEQPSGAAITLDLPSSATPGITIPGITVPGPAALLPPGAAALRGSRLDEGPAIPSPSRSATGGVAPTTTD